MEKTKLNIKLVIISWHVFIIYMLGAFTGLINVVIESSWLNLINNLFKLVNYPLYLLTLASVIYSIIEVIKFREKRNIICLVYALILLILEIGVIWGFFNYQTVLYI